MANSQVLHGDIPQRGPPKTAMLVAIADKQPKKCVHAHAAIFQVDHGQTDGRGRLGAAVTQHGGDGGVEERLSSAGATHQELLRRTGQAQLDQSGWQGVAYADLVGDVAVAEPVGDVVRLVHGHGTDNRRREEHGPPPPTDPKIKWNYKSEREILP